jgi:hypothetical protein
MATIYSVTAGEGCFYIQEIEGETLTTITEYPKGAAQMEVDSLTVTISGQFSKNILPIDKIAEPAFESVEQLQELLRAIIN